jgi:hypothetical protein
MITWGSVMTTTNRGRRRRGRSTAPHPRTFCDRSAIRPAASEPSPMNASTPLKRKGVRVNTVLS